MVESNKKIAILGSCVTRDLFDFEINETSKYEVSAYISRATLASIYAKDMKHLIMPDMSKIHGFDDRRFINDLHKNHIDILQNTEWDALIIDLIDERHATYFIEESALTYTKSSKDYIDSLLGQGIGQLLRPLSPTMLEYTKNSIAKLAGSLQVIQGTRPIFIHKAKYATHYILDGNRIQFSEDILRTVQVWNTFLEQMYLEFDRYKVFQPIVISDKLIVGGGTHKWDLTPFHYDRMYYTELCKYLDHYNTL